MPHSAARLIGGFLVLHLGAAVHLCSAASNMAHASPTYVIGHKNPDADAICSAIAYAAFKLARGEQRYAQASAISSAVPSSSPLASRP